MACAPEDHGHEKVYDPGFGEYRCASCGHRLGKDGQAPVATRRMAPWRWPAEIRGRRYARRHPPVR